MSILSNYRGGLVFLAASIVAVGCRESEQIQSYTVPKEPPRIAAGEVASATGNQPAPQAPQAEPTDRMIAAILPYGDQAWFFKVVGPESAVDKVAGEIAAFFTTIRVNNDDKQITWRPSSTWKEEQGTGMRAATIIIPGDKPLELAVTKLSWPGTPAAMLSNVNRWRGQMQLPPIDEQQLVDTTSELKAGDATMTLVDLKGRFQSTMTPPFAGGAPFAGGEGAASRAAQDGTTNLPADHPPIGPIASTPNAPPAGDAQSNVPNFEVPKSWQVLPAEGMRKAAFSIADGPQHALVTVIEFSANAGPMITDPLQNVNRWRGEIGLAAVDKDGLGKVTEQIKIDGREATYAPAIPDISMPEESKVARATLAAMVRDGDRIWFIKLTGDRNLVAAQQQNFKDFLKSIRFTADRGATDGN